MNRIDTKLEGVCIIEPRVIGDQRGYFMETWSTRDFEELGLHYTFVQDNQSFSARKGTLRGIHFQNEPMAQAKMLRVIRGAILDVTVDLRKGSPTYKQWISVELSAEICYKVDNLYSAEHDRGIRFDDPEIGVDWGEVVEEALSQKDRTAPLLKDSDCNFVYGEIR